MVGRSLAIKCIRGTHGTAHPLYQVWYNMKRRCYDPDAKRYERYGGRGITVCNRWLDAGHDGFANFVRDMGERLKMHSLERINGNGDYKPSNCRWATVSEQMKNRNWTPPTRKLSDSDVITIRRRLKKEARYGLMADLAREYGVTHPAIRAIRTGEAHAEIT